MRPLFEVKFGRFVGEKKLNIGCGANPEEGWINVDFNPQFDHVLKIDLRAKPWPFEDQSFDTVLASHVLEHFRDEELFNIMAECGRVLRVGGHLIGITPHALHSSAYANPFHRQLWDQSTPEHFCRATYERKGSIGTGAHQFMPLVDWKVVHLELTPSEEWRIKPHQDITEAMKFGTNVIEELQFVMRRES